MPPAKQKLYVIPNPTPEDREWCVISEHPVFGEHQFNFDGEGEPLAAVATPFTQIPKLIADLQLAYNNHTGGELSAFGTDKPDSDAEVELIRKFV